MVGSVNYQQTITQGWKADAELRALNQEVKILVNGQTNGTDIRFLAMRAIGKFGNEMENRLANKLKDVVGNLNKLTAMNQLKEDTTSLTALRANGGLKEAATMEANATDTNAMYTKASQAGIAFSTTEADNWKTGKITKADIDTLESRIKTQQDAASNTSSSDNMELQKYNTLITQAVSMAMAFLDEFKKQSSAIWR